MPRPAKLRKHKGQWCTNAGDRRGVYFGRVKDVPYAEAKALFYDYLKSLKQLSRCHELPASSVAEVCDAHLGWVKSNRSDALFRQRKSLLNQFCNYRVLSSAGKRLPGHGELMGRIRAASIMRQHVDEYLDHRRQSPCLRTGHPLGDKGLRAIVIAVKACWNWAANPVEDDGGGLLPDDHRPLRKLPRGFVQGKDLTEADLPTDEEIKILFRWATVNTSKVRAGTGKWRSRRPDEFYDHPDWQVFADMLRVYYETGARTSELCLALIRDFMPRTRQICLGKHKRTRTQRNPSVRNLQLTAATAEILEKYVKSRRLSELLFVRHDGKPWDQNKINRRLSLVKQVAAQHHQLVRTHITPYSFRDLYISELLMIGTPVFQVAKMAGTSLQEIERTYGHFFNKDLATAQERLSESRKERNGLEAVQNRRAEIID